MRRECDFEQIKRSVSITMILDRYGILSELKRVGSTLKGTCPIHRGSNDRQFTVDETKGLFKCFSPKCNRGGDIITLVSETRGRYRHQRRCSADRRLVSRGS